MTGRDATHPPTCHRNQQADDLKSCNGGTAGAETAHLWETLTDDDGEPYYRCRTCERLTDDDAERTTCPGAAGRDTTAVQDAFVDGMVTWGCCGRTEDERDYILFDHCRRCHSHVPQSTDECPRCPLPPDSIMTATSS